MKWSVKFLVLGLLVSGISAWNSPAAVAQNPFEQFQKKVDEALPKGRLLRKLRDDLTGNKEKEQEKEKEKENQRQLEKRQAAEREREAAAQRAYGNRREPTPAVPPPGFVPPQQTGRIAPVVPAPGRAPNDELPPPFRFSGNGADQEQLAVGFGLQLDETENGLIVKQVVPGGNADQAGLQRGDRILQIGGVPVQTQAEWNEIAQILSAGDQIQIEWSSGGKKEVRDVGFGVAANRDESAVSAPTTPPPGLNSAADGGLDTRGQLDELAGVTDFLPPPAQSVQPNRPTNSVLRAAPESNRQLLAPGNRQSATAGQQEVELLRQTVDQQQQMIRQLQLELQQLKSKSAGNTRNSRGR